VTFTHTHTHTHTHTRTTRAQTDKLTYVHGGANDHAYAPLSCLRYIWIFSINHRSMALTKSRWPSARLCAVCVCVCATSADGMMHTSMSPVVNRLSHVLLQRAMIALQTGPHYEIQRVSCLSSNPIIGLHPACCGLNHRRSFCSTGPRTFMIKPALRQT